MDIFKRIQQDRGVCSNCFRQNRDIWEATHFVDSHHGEVWIRPMRDSIGSVTMIETLDPQTTDMDVHEGRKTACECGVEYNSMTVRPLTRKRFFKHAGRLADRLEERAVAFDRELFFDVLEDLKSDPDNQFADDEMYRNAAKRAITLPSHGGQRAGTA